MNIPYYKIAARIAGWQTFAFAIIFAIIFIAIVQFPGLNWKNFALLLPIVFLIDYFALQMALPSACLKYGLLICKDSMPVEPKGMILVGLTWGLVWRNFLIQLLVILIKNILILETGRAYFGLNISLSLFTCFFSALWLIKYQIGSTTIISEPHRIENNTANINSPVPLSHVRATKLIQETTSTILVSIAVLSYFAIGLVQLAAVFSFFYDYWHWWLVPSIVAGLFVSYLPVIGAIAGLLAAIEVWGWSWYWAIFLFFFPLVMYVIAIFGAGALAAIVLTIGRFRSR